MQDVTDALNSHEGSIVEIPESVADEVTINYVQAKQKYLQSFEVILTESASIVDLEQNYMANTLRIYVDERRVMKDTGAEIWYQELQESDGTRNRIQFSEILPVGSKIAVDFYQN